MITIFTPTYNREKLIKRVYESLCKQSNFDFEWLVVDDCSNDNTVEYLKSLDAKFPIRVYKTKTNSGKYRAYNLAIQECRGDYFICVDSDDWLTPEAVGIIQDNIKEFNKCIGYIYPQINNIKVNNDRWRCVDKMYVDIIDMKELYKINETAIVIKTAIIKRHLFPENSHERFCPESVLYNDLIKEGKFLAINKGFYNSEYQPNGITNNVFKTWMCNPQNVLRDLAVRYRVCGKYTGITKLIGKIKCIMNINALCLATKSDLMLCSPNRFLSILLLVPSVFWKKRRFKK